MGGYTQGFARYHDFTARELGLDGVALNATQTSNAFSTEGYNQLTTKVVHSNSSATAIAWYIEESDDNGTTWVRQQTRSVSTGTETLSDHTISKAVTGDKNFNHQLAITSNTARLVFSSTGGDASDLATVTVRVGVVS